MDPDIVIGLVGAAGVVGALAASLSGQLRLGRAAREVDGVWASWAARHRLAFEPARANGFAVSAPRAMGVIDGVFVTLDGMELDPDQLVAPTAKRGERGRVPHTSVSARWSGAPMGQLIVMSRARVEHRAPAAGYRQMDLADARFDEACAVWADYGAPTRALHDRRARAALAQLAQRPFVLLSGAGMLWIRWPGYERDEAMLDHAVSAIVLFARGDLDP